MSARAKPPAMPDAGQLALLDSIAERHPYRGVVKYCRRIKKGVRLTCSEDLWNVTMLCAWEHAFGEYREAVAISRLLDGYVFESYRYWGQVRWTYGLVAEAWHRLGEPGRAEETVARIMEHENPNYTTGDCLHSHYYDGNAESARREGRSAAAATWDLCQYCELVFCAQLPGYTLPAGELLARADALAARLRAEAGE